MGAILSLLIILTLSILITRIATVALTHTGLSRESARFQARSAFTGVGFTTSESEKIVGHPLRRRIVLLLMLLGNAGIVTAISTLILSFIEIEGIKSAGLHLAAITAGIVLLWTVASSQYIDQKLSVVISWALRRSKKFRIHDYANLLHLTADYRISELAVQASDWLAGCVLTTTKLRDEGVIVLGITRDDGTYIGAPGGNTRILPGDHLILYGRDSSIEKIDRRRKGSAGDSDHAAAVAEQNKIEQQESERDAERQKG